VIFIPGLRHCGVHGTGARYRSWQEGTEKQNSEIGFSFFDSLERTLGPIGLCGAPLLMISALLMVFVVSVVLMVSVYPGCSL